MPICNVRFMDNLKMDSYTVSNEDVAYPLSNAMSPIRSDIFKTTATSTRIVTDLGYPDKITALTLFAPLGEKLGISREATIRLQADNVGDWAAPEYDEVLSLNYDDRLVHFTDIDYRFVSLYIDDPTNPEGVISFADLYIGDYTTTAIRNIAPKFSWLAKDNTKVSKSLDGTPYFRERLKYDTFSGLKYSLIDEADRQVIQDLFNRKGISNWMPICLDPGEHTSSSREELTRLARFSKDLKTRHSFRDRYEVSLSLEEVI